MTTLKEIAKRANVSTATVSNVLNQNDSQVGIGTKELVLKIIKEMNYQPNRIAKSLRTKKTHTIGIIIEDITVFNSPAIINGIGEYAEEHGYNIILNNLRLYQRVGNNYADIEKCRNNISNLIESILSTDTDGVIYVGAHYRDVTGIAQGIRKPIVYTYCYADHKNSNWVNFDDEEASYDVVEYLMSYGHERIGLITGMVNSIPSQERLKGYQRAIINNKLFINPGYIKVGDWTYESGYIKAKELLSEPYPPTAVFAMNDLMAGGAIKAAGEMGLRIPEDLSLVGFDNRESSFFFVPKLTTVEIPLAEMGKLSAQSLIELLQDLQPTHKNIKLKCKILPRNSVGIPNET